MKKIIVLICIVGCMGMLFGCACGSSNSDDATTAEQVESTNNDSDNNTTAQKEPETTVKATPATTQKQTKKPEQNTQKPTQKQASKNTSSSLVGTWNWEGGVFAYVFKKDGSGVYKTGSERYYFTYKTKGNKIIIKHTDVKNLTKLKYRIEGKKLIIKDSSGDDVIYIKK